jgi:hypothetical protein
MNSPQGSVEMDMNTKTPTGLSAKKKILIQDDDSFFQYGDPESNDLNIPENA